MARTIYVPEAGRAIDFPDTATDDQIITYLRGKYAPAPTAPAAPAEAPIGAIQSGLYGLRSRVQTAVGKTAEAAGLEAYSQYLLNEARANQERAAKYQPEVADISQIEGVGDVASFAGSTIGQSLPESAVGIGGAYIGAKTGAAIGTSILPIYGTAAGAIAGGLIGGAIAALPSFIGGNLQAQAREQGIPLEETDLTAASVGAFAQAPLDAAFDTLVARKLPGSGVALDAVRNSFLKEIAKTAAVGAATEALTEPAQQAIEIAQANPNKLLEFSPDVQFELLNAAAGGALAGGVIGGGAGAVGRVFAPAETPQQAIGRTQLRADMAAEEQQSREMSRMAEINRGIEQFAAQPSIGQLKINKIRIEPTKENKLRAPIERFQVTDFKGTRIAEFSDPVNAVDAVSRYQKLVGKKINLQNLATGQEVPTQTVKPGKAAQPSKIEIPEVTKIKRPDVSGTIEGAAGISAIKPPSATVQGPTAPSTSIRQPTRAGVEPVAAPAVEPMQAPTAPAGVTEAAGIAAVEPPDADLRRAPVEPTIAPETTVAAPEAAPVGIEQVSAPTPEVATMAISEPPKPAYVSDELADQELERQKRLEARPSLLALRKSIIAEMNPLAQKGTISGEEAERFKSLGRKLSEVTYDLSRDKPLNPEKIGTESERMSSLPKDVVVQAYNDALKDRDVFIAINNAAFGVEKNAITDVDRLVSGPKGIALYESFAPTREAIRSAFGDTIKLYRAEGMQMNKPTKNWATTREYAKQFGDNIIERDVPVENILAVNVGNGNYHEVIVGDPPRRESMLSAITDSTEDLDSRPAITEPIGAAEAEAMPDVEFVSEADQERVRKMLEERIAKISTGVRSQLNKYGLKDVQAKFVPAFMDGLRFRAVMGEQAHVRLLAGDKSVLDNKSIITIATGIYDPDLTVEQLTDKVFEVLDHESIHSLVTLGLLRENEMQMLFRAAENTKVPGKEYTYLDRAKAVYTPMAKENPVYRNPEAIREEAVAEMFRDWRLKKLGPPKSVFGLINRITEAVRSMFNNMRRQNYDDVFQDIESGVIGARKREKSRARPPTPGERRIMAKPELPNLAFAPEYPYEQRVPEANAAQVNRVEHAVEYGAAINLIDRIMNSKTVRGATFFVPDVYRPDKNTWTRFVQNFADKMLPLGQFVDFIRQNGGTVPDALDAAMHEDLMRSRVGNFLADRERDLYKPLVEYLRDTNITLPEFEDYLYGLHAPERNERIRQINPNADPSIGSGMTDEEAASIVDAVDRDPRRNDFYAARDLFRRIIEDTNQLRVESGLTPDFDQQFVNDEDGNPVAIKPYENYVPLRGFADESVTEGEVEEELRARVGQGFKIRGREDMRAFGRQSKASDLIAHAILQNSEALIRAEKNKVGLSLLGLIEANPELAARQGVEILSKGKKPLKKYVSSKGVVKSMVDPMYKNSDDVMVVKREGEEIPIRIDNPFLQKALLSKKTGNPDIADKTLRFFQNVNRWLASVNTALNPEFMLINFPRDLQTALVNISQYEIEGIKYNVFRDALSSVKGVHAILRNPDTQNEWSDWYKMFLEDGGNTNGFFGTFTLADRLDEISKIAQDQSGSPKRRAVQAWEFVRDTLENMNGAFENAIRLSVYKNTIDAGVDRKRAAQIAKNLTVNFDKRGIYGPFLNSLYLFFNASVQGTFAMATAAGRSSKVRKAFGAMIVVGMLQDQINSMFSDEDEDGRLLYDKIPDYKLQSNLIIMDPFGFTETGYFSFPLPYGFNAFYNAGRSVSRNVRGEYTTSQAATSIGSTFVDAFNPIGGTESLLNFIAPTTLDPLVALTINQDFTGRRIYPEPFPGSVPKANSQLYWTSTSPIFKNVSQFLNEATGGSEYVSGTIDMNPAVLEYIYDYFTGGLGTFVRRTYDTATNKIPEALNGDLAAIEANDFPLFRKLYGNVSERVSFEDYFDKVNHVLARGEEMKSAIKSGDPERIKSVRARFADELKIYPAVRALANRRNQLASQLRKVRENEKMAPEVKRQRIEALQKQIEQITGRVGKLYEDNIDTGYPSLFS